MIDAKTWTRICDLFDRLVELPTEARTSVLDDECGQEDTQVRAEVERMLAADRTSLDLDRPIAHVPSFGEELEDAPGPGTLVGGFELVEVLAEGGMATVYRAEQKDPSRTVALKMRRGDLFSAGGLRRFRYEAEVLASMTHPGIAQLFEAGTHWRKIGGQWVQQPFVAIELVDDALDIVSYARKEKLNVVECLALFDQLCDAIAYSHRNGILHRDLKAENILVDGSGRVRVIDFGIARPVELTEGGERLTLEGQIVGTLATMSPEQLGKGAAPVDARSDVYALGAVLYELLEGAPLRNLAGLPVAEAVEVITNDAAIEPQHAPTELRWVLQRALELDPERRYPSVDALAEDIRRFRNHEPLIASPPGRMYAARKFVRRNRTVVLTVIAVIAALAVGLVRAEMSRRDAVHAKAEAEFESRRASAIHDFVLGIVLNAGGPEATVVDLLDSGRTRLDTLLKDDPTVRANAQATLAKAYMNLDLIEQGGELLEEAREFELTSGVPGSETWFQVQLDWTAFLLREQRCAEALDLVNELIEWSDEGELMGLAAHANLLARQGVMLRCLERIEEARASYERSLDWYREWNLPKRGDYWNVVETLAECQSALGDVDAALELREAVVVGREAELGSDDSRFAASVILLGTAYSDLGRHEEALPHLRRGVEVIARTQGEDYWGLAMPRNNLACCLMQLGEFDEAREEFAESIRIADSYLGSNMGVIRAREAGFFSLVNLGFLDRHQGKNLSAVEQFERGLDTYSDLSHLPTFRVVRLALAKEYETLAELPDALAVVREVCADHANVADPDARLSDLELLLRLAESTGETEGLETLFTGEIARRAADGPDTGPIETLLERVRD